MRKILLTNLLFLVIILQKKQAFGEKSYFRKLAENTSPNSSTSNLNCRDQNCLSCLKNPNICEDCKEKYFNYNGSCLKPDCFVENCKFCRMGESDFCSFCNDGYKDHQGICIKKCTEPNCKKCIGNQSKCEECNDGYTLKRDHCVTECSIKNCSGCNSKDYKNQYCILCNKNYQLYKGECFSTETTTFNCENKNCKVCSNENLNLCLECKEGHENCEKKQPNKSLNCGVANCINCSENDSTICSLCQPEFYLKDLKTCIAKNSKEALPENSSSIGGWIMICSIALAIIIIYICKRRAEAKKNSILNDLILPKPLSIDGEIVKEIPENELSDNSSQELASRSDLTDDSRNDSAPANAQRRNLTKAQLILNKDFKDVFG